MADKQFDVFVAAETGFLKGVHVEKKSWENVNVLESVTRDQEITALCWGDTDQSQVCFGLKNQTVRVYDVAEGEVTESLELHGGKGAIRGLARYDNRFITCVESGLLQLWSGKDQENVEIEVGENVHRMVQNSQQPHLLATGGKENDLKLWDLNRPEEAVFKAKNVRNDWLNLRVPVWVLDAAFLPDSQKIATCTGHHQVRLYDPNTTQRRPVIDVQFDEYPLTSMGLVANQPQVVVGNTHGNMALIDLRKAGKVVHSYKGFAGAIRSVECHPTLPLVATCGLDRFLRVHHIESKQLLHKVYMKSRLNCVLISESWLGESTATDQSNGGEEIEMNQSDDSGKGSDSDQELWDQLQEVKSKTTKRKPKATPSNTNEPTKKKHKKIKEQSESVDSETETKKKKKSSKWTEEEPNHSDDDTEKRKRKKMKKVKKQKKTKQDVEES